jgi:CubicO group peptidase (beta-lactamase class C family)
LPRSVFSGRGNPEQQHQEQREGRDDAARFGFGAQLVVESRVCYKRPTKSSRASLRRGAIRGSPSLKSATEPRTRFPTPDFADQERRFARAFALLREAIAAQAFPGASLAVTHRGKLVALAGFGRITYDGGSPGATAETVFDLASLTKVLATTAMAMLLFERGVLDLEAPVAGILPEFRIDGPRRDPRRAQVTLRMLLAHSSGLPGYLRLYQSAKNRDEMLAAACAAPLAAEPGTRAEYSDIGFIVLGEALSRLADEPLDRFCQREVFGPLGMSATGFCPPAEWKERIPPTVDDRDFRRRVVQGEVQDENAFAMGGVAGHAGLFGAARDVATFAHVMLEGGAPILRPETVALFIRREAAPPGTSRALGWDTPSAPSQSGRHFSPRSFGHLGYTGTSLWCDPERTLSVTLLTNRTWPDCGSEQIKQVRPAFHDAIVEALS